MEVPERARTPQLKVSMARSEAADITEAPGATTSGLTRPSWVQPLDENTATQGGSWSPCTVAPTPTTFLPVAGEPMVLSPGPALPPATNTRKSGWCQMKRSMSAVRSVYLLKGSTSSSSPHESEWIRAPWAYACASTGSRGRTGQPRPGRSAQGSVVKPPSWITSLAAGAMPS